MIGGKSVCSILGIKNRQRNTRWLQRARFMTVSFVIVLIIILVWALCILSEAFILISRLLAITVDKLSCVEKKEGEEKRLTGKGL